MELKDGLDLLFLFLFYFVIIAKERTFIPAHKTFLFLSLPLSCLLAKVTWS